MTLPPEDASGDSSSTPSRRQSRLPAEASEGQLGGVSSSQVLERPSSGPLAGQASVMCRTLAYFHRGAATCTVPLPDKVSMMARVGGGLGFR